MIKKHKNIEENLVFMIFFYQLCIAFRKQLLVSGAIRDGWMQCRLTSSDYATTTKDEINQH